MDTVDIRSEVEIEVPLIKLSNLERKRNEPILNRMNEDEEFEVALHNSENEDDDDDYHYAYDDDDDTDGFHTTPAVGLQGLDFGEGASSLYAVQSKIPVLSLYRNLANVCLVDVNDDFYSATLTVISNTGSQTVTAQIRFPSLPPFFPEAPPQFILQSVFRAPLQRINIIFNCHPTLLKQRWNPCTDIACFLREISDAAQEAIAEGIDKPDSYCRTLIELFNINQVDITHLYPQSKFGLLPFFTTVQKLAVSSTAARGPAKGVGYSRETTTLSSVAVGGLSDNQHSRGVSKLTVTLLERMHEHLSKLPLVPFRTAVNDNNDYISDIQYCTLSNDFVDAFYFLSSFLVVGPVPLLEVIQKASLFIPLLKCLFLLPLPSAHLSLPSTLFEMDAAWSAITASTSGIGGGCSSGGGGSGNEIRPATFPSSVEKTSVTPRGQATILKSAKRTIDALIGRSASAAQRVHPLTGGARGGGGGKQEQPSSVAWSSGDDDMLGALTRAVVSRYQLMQSHVSGDLLHNNNCMAMTQLASSNEYDAQSAAASSMAIADDASLPVRLAEEGVMICEPENITEKHHIISTSTSDTTASGMTSLPPLATQALSRIVYLDAPFAQHSYINDMSRVTVLPAKWYRRLRFELASFEEALPSSVLVFSGLEAAQPNLLKVIMFPESVDCPYCGGAFEFDFFIPESYPLSPPLVNFCTTGEGSVRFNPNLYASGKVCLSLLGTWAGEPWDPLQSTLSQVINSILFLIFVDEPFFNEPGYQALQNTPDGTSKSVDYNKFIRKMTLKLAYLEHMKRSSGSRTSSSVEQLRPWVLDRLVRSWVHIGRDAARMWGAEDSDVTLLVEDIERMVASIK